MEGLQQHFLPLLLLLQDHRLQVEVRLEGETWVKEEKQGPLLRQLLLPLQRRKQETFLRLLPIPLRP